MEPVSQYETSMDPDDVRELPGNKTTGWLLEGSSRYRAARVWMGSGSGV